MNDARPALPRDLGTLNQPGSQVTGRASWLAALSVGDRVAVYCGSVRMQDSEVTSAPRTLISIGKHANRRAFRRSDGMLASKMYRRHLFRIEQP